MTVGQYQTPTMRKQYPEIWVRFHADGFDGTGDGFWQCTDQKGGERFVLADGEISDAHAIWAYEDVIGFGYGTCYRERPNEDEEKWWAEGATYRLNGAR